MSSDSHVDDQVLPLLAKLESDPSQSTTEFSRVIGRVLKDGPDTSSLRHLRSELAATAERIRGEHGAKAHGDDTAVAAVVEGYADVLAGYVDRAENTAAEPAVDGSSPLREQVLCRIAEGASRPSEIADLLGRRRTHVSAVLSQLVDAALVSVDTSVLDGRVRCYALTDEGRDLIDA